MNGYTQDIFVTVIVTVVPLPTPIPQQVAIIDAARDGRNTVVTALAGTGKTTTTRMIADAIPGTGLYLAYNRTIADDAQGKFPNRVLARTGHGLARSQIGKRYGHDSIARRLDERMGWVQMAEELGIRRNFTVGQNKRIKTGMQARLAREMLTKFCFSADAEVQAHHCPIVEGLLPWDQQQLAGHLLPYARRLWDDVRNPLGKLRFTHDDYLKMWVMTRPRLFCDYVIFDEAQDANPIISQLVDLQDHCQKIIVGDSYQSIYTWRGAVDAMDKFEADVRLPLTQSFRFGDAIAEVANSVLDQLKAKLRVLGNPRIKSEVVQYDWPHVTLCRTNAGALRTLLAAQERNFGTFLVGGTGDIGYFCRSVQALKAGRPVSHPDLLVFPTWGDVQDHIEEDPDTEFALLVKLVEQFGEDKIVSALEDTTREDLAEMVISTTHKAKGREWLTVGICEDFDRKRPNTDATVEPQLAAEALRLRYVAVTRAIELLDPGPIYKQAA